MHTSNFQGLKITSNNHLKIDCGLYLINKSRDINLCITYLYKPNYNVKSISNLVLKTINL